MMYRIGVALGMACLLATPAAAGRGPSGDSVRINKMSRIVAQNYPADSLARGEQGVVHFSVALDESGRLERCAVTRSSGYPRLDRATCDMLVRHGQFRAAADAHGNRHPTVHLGQVAWRHPDGAAVAPPPPTDVSQSELASLELICRRDLKNGSIIIKTKYCLSRSDWRRAYDNARRETRRMTGGLWGM